MFLFTLRRGKRVSNGLLGTFFLSFGLNLLDTLLLLKGVYFRYPSWGLWGSNMALLFGPLLYLYTRSVVLRDFRLSASHWLTALPFGLITAVSLVGFHLQPTHQQQLILKAIIANRLPESFYIVSALIFGHFLIHLLLSLRLIDRYRRALANRFSDVRHKNLNWLASTIRFFLLFFGLSLLRGFVVYTPLASYQFILLLSLLLALFWFTNRFLLNALQSPELFAGVATEDLATAIPVAPPTPDPAYAPLLQQLADYMQIEKPYLEPELTLDELAQRLGTRPKLLSVALNNGLGQHFFDYVNHYRIDEAKRLLTNPSDPKVTVLEVMYEVGFNSKSSFNTLFRKYTGQTPTEFKKRPS